MIHKFKNANLEGGKEMTEKDLWKWILDNFSDNGVASIGRNLGLKIPGFRQINPQLKNFKVLRPKLIHEALSPKNINDLKGFFNSVAEEKEKFLEHRGKSKEELLLLMEEEITPSILLSVLLSSGDKNDINNALELAEQLTEEGRLDQMEKYAEENFGNEDVTEKEEEAEPSVKDVDIKKLQQKIAALEKKLVKSEQKNEELKAKVTDVQNSLNSEKKLWKEDKKGLTQEIHTLKSQQGGLKSSAEAAYAERDSMEKKMEQQKAIMKKKDEEISRLNAVILNFKTQKKNNPEEKSVAAETGNTEQDQPSIQEENRVNVAVIGDPKNTRVQRYHKFNLNIIEASDLEEEKQKYILETADQIWLLTYKIPRSVHKRLKTVLKNRDTQEFATFVDLEKHMQKG
jgi:chromosome segregation ATPase